MAKKSTQKKTKKPERDAFQLKGSKVVITRLPEREIAQIDGQIVEFVRTKAGYRLKCDVFREPAKSLREAVERYLESEVAQ